MIISLAVFLIAAALMLGGLGSYSLWDDEAMDALSAKGIMASGDTTAVLGKNIVAYRGGLLLVNLRHQGMCPLPAYVTACSFKLFGVSAWSARLPFALSGILSVGLMLHWGIKLRVSATRQLLLGLAIIGNVSFLLYFRNCHYYGIGILLNIAIVYLYLYRLSTPSGQYLLALASGLLMTANYTWFVALYACLFIDYLLWRRHVSAISLGGFIRVFVPQVPFGLAILAWWNPLGTHVAEYLQGNTITDRVWLFFWNWRDLNICEFISATLLLGACWLACLKQNIWLRRMLVALVTYVSIVTVLSTQVLKGASVCDIRYLAGSLPLCIAISVLVIGRVERLSKIAAVFLALIAFGTNLLNGGPLLPQGLRSTITAFVEELVHPQTEPYTPTATWIKEHVPSGSSIWVLPDYMNYPLMFHAPEAVYAWQLERGESQFNGLDPIHFKGEKPPDFIITFGPVIQEILPLLKRWAGNGTHYENAAKLDVFWEDRYRPELFWRTFETITDYDRSLEAVSIFRRSKPQQFLNAK